ncbi:family 16 glycoside hydrolase [Chloroflexota bacterium]
MKPFRYPLVALCILSVVMIACGRDRTQEAAVPTARPTRKPTYTFTPTTTLTPVPPTATPIPPTETPLPTDTPLPPTDTPPPTETPIPATATLVPPTDTPRPTKKPAAPTKTPLPPTPTPVPWLLKESFDDGRGDGWQVFTNYWRVHDGQWYWAQNEGVDGTGALGHNCCQGGDEGEDALMMYLGEGAEEWTDYRVEAQFKVPNDEVQKLGLWVRGQYEEKGRKDTAKEVTGYYIMLDRRRIVRLMQLQTPQDCVGACNPQWMTAFNNPYTLHDVKVDAVDLTRNQWHTIAVEVRGNRISIWVDGVFTYDYVDSKEPFMKGTVGFKTFESRPALFDNVVVTPLE